ncbi:MAG TPA: addiction module protein, partial [Verrucomicrobiae bacterium]|nr:addiction module protein [Verrucomicrobiae bacterium]
MATTANLIERKLLKLPPGTRLTLAEKLMASVDDFATPEVESSWDDEIEARVREIREGKAGGIAADEVKVEARKKL